MKSCITSQHMSDAVLALHSCNALFQRDNIPTMHKGLRDSHVGMRSACGKNEAPVIYTETSLCSECGVCERTSWIYLSNSTCFGHSHMLLRIFLSCRRYSSSMLQQLVIDAATKQSGGSNGPKLSQNYV